MIIKTLLNGEFVEGGSIKYEDGKVTLTIPNHTLRSMFEKILLGTEAFTPDQGWDYIEAMLDKYESSSGIALIKEKGDTWLEEDDPTEQET